MGKDVRKTLDSIYRGHRQGLFTLAMSITRQADAAEDAVQAAFERLVRTGRAPTGDPVAYVFAAVRNAALDAVRRRNGTLGQPASIYNGRLADYRDPAGDLMDEETERLVRQAVDQLPDSARQVVVLKLYADLTFEQIAETLGEPMGTVASRYRRSLDKLKDSLSGKV